MHPKPIFAYFAGVFNFFDCAGLIDYALKQ